MATPVRVLMFKSENDHQLAELTDPTGQYGREELSEMTHELRQLYQQRDQRSAMTVRFQKPARGLPACWQAQPMNPSRPQRGYFVRLVSEGADVAGAASASPLSQPPKGDASPTTESRNRDTPPPSTDSAARPTAAPAAGMSGHVTSKGAGPSTMSQSAASGMAGLSTTGSRPAASAGEHVRTSTAAESASSTASEAPQWQNEFFNGVAKLLNDVMPAARSSDRAAQGEILELVMRESGKNPEQFTLVLYQSLIRTLHLAAEKEHRFRDLPRLEIVLNGLDQMCRSQFMAAVDCENPRPERRDGSWLTQVLRAWL